MAIVQRLNHNRCWNTEYVPAKVFSQISADSCMTRQASATPWHCETKIFRGSGYLTDKLQPASITNRIIVRYECDENELFFIKGLTLLIKVIVAFLLLYYQLTKKFSRIPQLLGGVSLNCSTEIRTVRMINTIPYIAGKSFIYYSTASWYIFISLKIMSCALWLTFDWNIRLRYRNFSVVVCYYFVV